LAEDLLRRLRFSNEICGYVTELVRDHLVVYDPSWTDAAVRRWLKRVSTERWRDVIALAHADVRAKGREVPDEIERLEQLTQRAARVIAAGAALSTRDLKGSGRDLLVALAGSPGPIIGKILRQLLEDVIECPEMNQREQLLERARVILSQT